MRNKLLFEHGIFTGSAAQADTIRLLPPLNIGKEEVDVLLEALRLVLV